MNLTDCCSNFAKTTYYRFWSIFGHRNYRRFMVLGRSRVGSNLLISYLNSHPSIQTKGEIFQNLNNQDYNKILSREFCKKPSQIRASGFKIFYYHPLDNKSTTLWNTLEADLELQVIHLKRRNILQTLVSRKIAEITDVWAQTIDDMEESNSAITLVLDKNELEDAFCLTREMERHAEKQFSNHQLISIEYENLITNTQSVFKKLTDFLDVEYSRPQTPLLKQNSRSLREIITNYDALFENFRGTQWEEFFQEKI